LSTNKITFSEKNIHFNFIPSDRYVILYKNSTDVLFIIANYLFFLYHQLPNIMGVLYVTIVSIIIFAIGLLIFRKLEKGFAEQV